MTAAVATKRATQRSSGARRRPEPRRAQQKRSAPKLRVLDQQAIKRRARRRNALLTLFIIVLIGFFGVALVHAQLVAGQQDLDDLRARIAEAESHRAQVARAVEEAAAPASIVDKATGELGMVRAVEPVYLVAAAPLRDVPTAIPLAPVAQEPTFDLAVAADADRAEPLGMITAVDDPVDTNRVDTGQVVTADQVVTAQQVVTADQAVTPAVEVAADAASGDDIMPAVATTAQPVVSQPSQLGGTTVSVGGSSSDAGVAVTSATGSSAADADTPVSSFAGSRAVSVGHGSG